uniref:Uncharacterized protein n=1 Tax=Oryza brachyantha TaxID=4533 RepID=J3LBH9_ORYBR
MTRSGALRSSEPSPIIQKHYWQTDNVLIITVPEQSVSDDQMFRETNWQSFSNRRSRDEFQMTCKCI